MVLAYAQIDSFVFCYKNLHKYFSLVIGIFLIFMLLNHRVDCFWKHMEGFSFVTVNITNIVYKYNPKVKNMDN